MCNAQDDQSTLNFPGRFSSLKKNLLAIKLSLIKYLGTARDFPLNQKFTNPILKTTLFKINNRKLIETNKCNVSSIFYYEFFFHFKNLKILS